MIAALFVFVLVCAIVVGAAVAITRLPESAARRRVELRLREVSRVEDTPDEQQLVRQEEGTLPVVERFVRQTSAGAASLSAVRVSACTSGPARPARRPRQARTAVWIVAARSMKTSARCSTTTTSGWC